MTYHGRRLIQYSQSALLLRGPMFSDLVPCFSIVSVLLVIFGFLAFLRYMNYKETLALAEKGLTKPEI